MKKKVLFVCIHNSARSQMAEAYVNAFASDRYVAESAGIEPGRLNPVVVKAMQSDGIDISQNRTKTVAEMIAAGKTYDFIVTVCDETSAERCPVIPGGGQRLHMGFPDPSALKGSDEDKLAKTVEIRDKIKDAVRELIRRDFIAP